MKNTANAVMTYRQAHTFTVKIIKDIIKIEEKNMVEGMYMREAEKLKFHIISTTIGEEIYYRGTSERDLTSLIFNSPCGRKDEPAFRTTSATLKTECKY